MWIKYKIEVLLAMCIITGLTKLLLAKSEKLQYNKVVLKPAIYTPKIGKPVERSVSDHSVTIVTFETW